LQYLTQNLKLGLDSEQFKTLIDARRKEAEIKGWRREKKENLFSQQGKNVALAT